MAALTPEETATCQGYMKNNASPFMYASDNVVSRVASDFVKQVYKKDEIIIEQGKAQKNMFIMHSGVAERTRVDGSGSSKVIEQFGMKDTAITVGALHFLRNDKAYGNLKCVTDECIAFSLSSDKFRKSLEVPEVSENVVYSLQRQIRQTSNILRRTPLNRQVQTSQQSPIVATSVAATFESFYRSALNAYINAHLTGTPVTKLFPDMHVQVPMRVLYINGTKGTRAWLGENVDPTKYENPNFVGTAVLLAPGLIMTPISSVLEAANAGHRNPMPLHTRWTCGIMSRSVREIIFAIGLNQASDYMEERVPSFIESGVSRNMIGSLTAGTLAGYFSHVPHNLSALKLMEPNKSYTQLFKEYAKVNEDRVPKNWSAGSRTLAAQAIGILAPRAVTTRTVQIVGTFVILNGIIFCLRDVSPF